MYVDINQYKFLSWTAIFLSLNEVMENARWKAHSSSMVTKSISDHPLSIRALHRTVLPRLQVGIVTYAELIAYQPALARSFGFYPLCQARERSAVGKKVIREQPIVRRTITGVISRSVISIRVSRNISWCRAFPTCNATFNSHTIVEIAIVCVTAGEKLYSHRRWPIETRSCVSLDRFLRGVSDRNNRTMFGRWSFGEQRIGIRPGLLAVVEIESRFRIVAFIGARQWPDGQWSRIFLEISRSLLTINVR